MNRRKLWIILGGISAAGAIYFGAYLYFRLNHTFTHRSGNYAYDSRLEKERHTNHHIEPAPHFDRELMAAVAALGDAAAAQNPGGETETDPAFEKLMKEAGLLAGEKERARERLFAFFKPAAFLETVAWKVIDPNPAIP